MTPCVLQRNRKSLQSSRGRNLPTTSSNRRPSPSRSRPSPRRRSLPSRSLESQRRSLCSLESQRRSLESRRRSLESRRRSLCPRSLPAVSAAAASNSDCMPDWGFPRLSLSKRWNVARLTSEISSSSRTGDLEGRRILPEYIGYRSGSRRRERRRRHHPLAIRPSTRPKTSRRFLARIRPYLDASPSKHAWLAP